MTALNKERMSRFKSAGGMDFPVAAAVKIYKGAYVVLSGGYLQPLTSATGLKPVGKASDNVDNTTGANGDLTCHVEFPTVKRLFKFVGDPSHLFAQANVGGPAYGLDDQTATTLGTSRTPVGTAWAIESLVAPQTVWVEQEAAEAEAQEDRLDTLEAEFAAIPNLQKGRGVLTLGVLNVTTGVTIAAGSSIVATRVLAGGTPGVELRTLSADRTNGGSGVGAFKVRAYKSDGTAETSDTSTVEYVIVG